MKKIDYFVILFPIAIGFIMFPFTHLITQIIAGEPFNNAIMTAFLEYFSDFVMVILFGGFTLIPFICLSVYLYCIIQKEQLTSKQEFILCLSGLFGIFIILLPCNISTWGPRYGIGQGGPQDSIGFVFYPFLSIPTMFLGVFIVNKIFRFSLITNN